jgi:gas vesicle protein
MDDSKGLSYFLLGLGIGTAVGILFAPHAGEKTRTIIRDKAIEGGDYLKQRGQDIKESAEEAVERSKTAIQKQKENLAAAIDAGKQAYREAVVSPNDTRSSEV